MLLPVDIYFMSFESCLEWMAHGGFAQPSGIKIAPRLSLFQMRLGEVLQRKSRSRGNWADDPNI